MSLQLLLEFKQVIFIWVNLIYNLMKRLDLECENGFGIGSFNKCLSFFREEKLHQPN